METLQGKVKWFSQAKGFGFITGNDGKDYFLHYSNIKMDGFKTLSEGDEVEFNVEATDKGDKATNVKKI
jgi:CspA family cold shock protein